MNILFQTLQGLIGWLRWIWCTRSHLPQLVACQKIVIVISGRQLTINTFCCLFGSTVSTLFAGTCQPVLPAIFLLLVDAHAVNRTDQAFPCTKTNCLTRINLGFFRAKWQAIAGI